MVVEKPPATPAVLFLRERGVEFRPHSYRYDKGDVTGSAAREVGVSTHEVVKTLVMEDDEGNPFIVLMHGDMQVSTKNLARTIGVKSVSPTDRRTAKRLTGYDIGGISPFGTRRELPVYVEGTILKLPRFFINGGRRGLLLEITPRDLVKVLDTIVVNVARD